MDARIPIEQARPGYHWFARAVLGFDAWLRRRNGVYEYSVHPHCAFRMQIARVRRRFHWPTAPNCIPATASSSCIFGTSNFRVFPAEAQR